MRQVQESSAHLSSGVNQPLGMMLGPLALSLLDLLLEVQGCLGQHCSRDRNAVDDSVAPPILQLHGSLHEDDMLALQDVHTSGLDWLVG